MSKSLCGLLLELILCAFLVMGKSCQVIVNITDTNTNAHCIDFSNELLSILSEARTPH
jgi:hypothetical protein